MNKVLIIVLLTFVGVLTAVSQNPNLGIPFIHAYPKNIYQSGAQNGSIAQGENGVMFFANNNGLMYFDGTIWKTFPLPNSTIVRSVAIAKNGDIYVGGQNEFGKFVPNQVGGLSFHSLKDLIPKAYQDFEDVWDIVILEDMVCFIASNRLYKIQNEACKVFDGRPIEFLGSANDQVIVQDVEEGLLYLKSDQLELMEGTELFKGKLVSGILSGEQSLIVSTFRNGLYSIDQKGVQAFKTDADAFLKQNNIVSVAQSKNGQLALGTDFAGVLILDTQGKSIFHLDRSNSLLNNKVFSVFFDKSQNLWLGVDNGINYIEVNSPFTRIYPDESLEGAGYAVKIFESQIYMATSNGLYVTEWKENYEPLNPAKFELVKNTKGQTWGLDIIEEQQLFLGHTDGAFLVEKNSASQIYNETGVWNFETLNSNKEYVLAGTYKNFSLFKKEGEKWQHRNDFEDWFESSRFVEQDNEGNIWVAHPYKGIFKIRLENDNTSLQVKKYGGEDGLPSDNYNHLFKVKGEIVYCGEKGLFLYNQDKDKFESYTTYNEFFGAENKIRRLQEAPNNDIWFITENEIGILKIEDRGLDKKIKKQVFTQFKNQLNSGFEAIYPYDDKNVFITKDKGFIHYNPSFRSKTDSSFNVLLNEVRVSGGKDSIVFMGYKIEGSTYPSFDANDNGLHFRFSGTDYVGQKFLQYRYYLEGYEKDWQGWTNENIKEYTNLSPGKYTFNVQAKNQSQILSVVSTYDFEILAPWYATKIAFAIYALLAFLLLGGIIRAYQRKYYGLKKDRDDTIQASQEEIGKLKEEKVKVELEFKQRELVSTTMHLVQKNETLGTVKNFLVDLKKSNKDADLSKEIQKMLNMLQQEEVMDDGWEQFMMHFNQLHGDFYNRLKSKYAALTPKDLKLCTYLRMNLSTKEMASLLNVTTRGIEASRYRLRKKIQLEKEENLTDFLIQF